jgi:hypothetical protein
VQSSLPTHAQLLPNPSGMVGRSSDEPQSFLSMDEESQAPEGRQGLQGPQPRHILLYLYLPTWPRGCQPLPGSA